MRASAVVAYSRSRDTQVTPRTLPPLRYAQVELRSGLSGRYSATSETSWLGKVVRSVSIAVTQGLSPPDQPARPRKGWPPTAPPEHCRGRYGFHDLLRIYVDEMAR